MSTKIQLPSLNSNGLHPPTNSNWREAAINRALLTEAREGDGTDVLVAAARTHLPGCVTLTQWLDVERVLSFLRECASDVRSLLAGEDLFSDMDSIPCVQPHTYWYAARWRGEEIEVATRPSGYRNTSIMAITRSTATAQALSEALENFALRPTGRCLKYAAGWESAPEMDESSRNTRWEDVVLAPEISTAVRESVEGFLAGKDAYKALGFAWRRGILLVGPPGTGKTMLCKAAAASLPDWPLLYVRNMSEHCQRESFREIFFRARKLSPCLLIFEDIDGLVNDDNRTIFLNEMDGFRSNDGLLIIASSNHPGKIDEALLKRPSRFDRVFHVGLPKKPERAAYCRQLLSRGELAVHITPDLDIEDLAEKAAARSDGFTPAYLKEAITAAALSRAQAGAMTLDANFAAAVLAEIASLRSQMKRSKDPEGMATLSGGSDSIGLRRREEN